MKGLTFTGAEFLKMEIRRAEQEKLELTLLQQIRAVGLLAPQREYRFCPDRKWRFDFAWPELLLAVEVQGGTYSAGKHTRGVGYTLDCEKIGGAMVLGWTVYCCDTKLVHNGQAIEIIEQLYKLHAKT